MIVLLLYKKVFVYLFIIYAGMATHTKGLGNGIRKIFSLLRLDKKDITIIYFYSVIAGIVSFTLPLGIQAIIGFVMAASYSTSIFILIALVLAGTFFNGLLQVKQLQLIEKIEQKLFVRYAFEYATRLPKLNLEKLDTYYLPELVNRFFDISSLQKSLHKVLVDIPTALFQVLIGTILLSFYHSLFIVFGLFMLLMLFVILRFTSQKGFSTSLETSDYKYKIGAWLEEIARSIKSFKYSKASSLHIEKIDQLTTSYLVARTSHFKILKFQFWSLISFKLMTTAAMLSIGVWLLVNQQINIGQFIASDIVIILIMASIEKLIGSMDQVYDILTSVEKLDKIVEAEIEYSGSMRLEKSQMGLHVVFDKISYQYDGQNDALSHFNLDLKAGQWALITGKSGSGKSTVLRLLTGAFRNYTGKLLINGLPLSNYNVASLRDISGILLGQQDIFLGTLKDNLTMGIPGISNEEIMEKANLTGLNTFIEYSEYGLDTPIDPIGKRLPTEIRQLMLLTRAILGKSALMLLENPFRYLNNFQIDKLINFIKQTKATVIISSESNEWKNYCDIEVELFNTK